MTKHHETMRSRTVAHIILTITLLLLIAGMLPSSTHAQIAQEADNAAQQRGGYFLTPSVSLTEVFDDNIFFTSDQTTSDFITRITPRFETGYVSDRLSWEGSYSLDSEFYAKNSGLNSLLMRQDAGIELEYLPDRLMTLGFAAGYDETENPGELNLQSGVDLPRSPARRYTFSPSAAYRLDPRMTAFFDYSYSHDALQGGINVNTHVIDTAIARQLNRTDSLRFGYTYRRFAFDTGNVSDSHLAMLEWAHQFSPRTSFTAAAGPRFTESFTDFELEARLAVDHLLNEQDRLSAFYERSETTAIGQPLPIEVNTIGASLVYSWDPDWQVRMTPDYSRGVMTFPRRGDAVVDSYRFNLETIYNLTDSLYLVGGYGYSLQQGSFLNTDAEDISRNVILLGIMFTTDSFTNRFFNPNRNILR